MGEAENKIDRLRTQQVLTHFTMESWICQELSALRDLSKPEFLLTLKSQDKNLELTRGLINIVFNLCHVQSIHPTDNQKRLFAEKIEIIEQLLSPRLSLKSKHNLLLRNISLALAITESCPLLD